MEKKAVIVGAGVAGLAAAVRLRHAGYVVVVHEQGDGPGGKMGVVAGEGFRFDLGPTIVMMPEVYEEVFRLCGRDPKAYIPMRQVTPLYDVHFRGGRTLPVSSDLAQLRRMIEAVAPDDVQGYLDYLADVHRRYQVAKAHFIERSFRGPGDFYNPKTLWNALRLRTFDSAYRSISRFVKTEALRDLLSFQTLYIGVSPFNGPSIYTIIPMIELLHGVWFLEGGMASMARGMERLGRELGVRYEYGSRIEEVLVEGGRAVGVRSARTGEARADRVLVTADFPNAMKHLVKDRKARGKHTPEKLDRMDYSCSCLLLYLGLDMDLKGRMPLHNLLFSDDFEGNIRDIFEGRFPADPSMYVYAASTLDPSLAPAGKDGLYVLVPVADLKTGTTDWSDPSVVADLRARVLRRVADIPALAGFEDRIVYERMVTPLHFRDALSSEYGATFGLRPTLAQSNYFRPGNRSRTCRSLYFAGASTHPGAGVPIVLTSAKLAVGEILRDDREDARR